MKIIKDIKYDEKNALDIYLPDGLKATKTIVYIHGGGIESGDKYDFCVENFGKTFTSKGWALVSINYSLYPNTKFPAYLYECASALKFLLDNSEKYGLSKDLYVSGSSAGAYITMMLMCNDEYLIKVGVNKETIKGWISDDGQMTDHFNLQKYELGIDPWVQRISEYAPIYYINKDTKFSRLLVLYYDHDMPMRKEQNLLFVSTLKHFNNSLDITLHELHGTHCQGTFNTEEDGTYPFVTEILNWIR